MTERITISFRPGTAYIGFVIHEQPHGWFHPLHIQCSMPWSIHGRYDVWHAACPEADPDLCCIASAPSQLGMRGYFVGHGYDHSDDILAMRNAVSALVNIARAHGYTFTLIP